MSAFVAVLVRRGGAVDDALLARLAAPLAPHAALGGGSWRAGPVGMAMALLPARENATVGPHRDDAGGIVAGDVRLDAQAELRNALEAAGAPVPRDAGDETLLLAAARAWANDAPSQLRGDFSFALWDRGRQSLLCARDGLGVRPLFYADLDDVFVCSNVLDAVRAHPAVSARLHEPAIVSFLQWGFNVDLTTTTFTDVRRLPPAHQLIVSADRRVAAPVRHWSFPDPAPIRYRTGGEYVDHYRALLGEAVRDRLRVPRAAIFLSGGVDSTTIAATARRVAPETELRAWTTSVMSDGGDDDSRLAATVARRLGVQQELVPDDGAPPFQGLDDPSLHTPEPFDDLDWASSRTLLRRLADGSPVLLIGEDGDALFQPPGLLTMLRTWPPGEVVSRVLRYTVTHHRLPHTGLWLRRRLRQIGRPAEPPMPKWVRSDVLARAGIPVELRRARHRARPEAHEYLTGAVWQRLLESLDPAYTHAPIEARWPLLDTRLLEFVFAIPPVPWCQRKELPRVAFRGDLPEEVLRRPKTTIGGYFEDRVRRWRRAQADVAPAFSGEALEFVDASGVASALCTGGTEDVLAAWRALALDRWLRHPGRAGGREPAAGRA